MKLAPREIESFLLRAPVMLGVLVYGPDVGLVSQRAETLAHHIVDDLSDPFRVVNLEADALKDDPARLADELLAMSFGGGRRLVRLRDISAVAGIKEGLAGLRKDAAENAFLLVTAGDLPATSALRKLFEAEKNLVALPCYQDDARGLRTVVEAEFKRRNIGYANDVVDYLCTHGQGDRLIVLSEIEKLDLYLGASRQAMLEAAEACVGEATESSFDDICAAVADGNQRAVERHVRKALQQGAAAVGILRATQRYYTRLHRTASMAASSGMGVEQAVAALRPPVFFKQKPAFTRHVSRWTDVRRQEKLWAVMDVLYQAEISCKTGGDPELLCSRALTQATAMSG